MMFIFGNFDNLYANNIKGMHCDEDKSQRISFIVIVIVG